MHTVVSTGWIRLAALGLCLAAWAGLAAGCGENEEKFRVEVFNPKERTLEKERSALSAMLHTVRLKSKRDEKRIRLHIERIRRAATAIADLDPPGQTGALMARYNLANDELIRELERFATSLGKGEKKKLDRSAERAQEIAGKVHRAEQALRTALSPED